MIRLAIVGMGRWGKTLVESVQGRSDCVRFSTVVSRSPERIGADAARLDLKLRATLDDALNDPEIDGIVLATPHSLHAEQIIACAAAAKPVFVEKPFTLTQAEAEQTIAAVKSAGIVCAAGHNRRFLPAMQALDAAMREGRLGKPICIESNYSGNVAGRYTADLWRVAPGESPAGGLAGAGIHMIDAIVSLLGPIAQVSAYSSRQALELAMDDTTVAIFQLRCGAAATLVTLMASTPDFRLKVFGTTGSAELRGQEQLIFTQLNGQGGQTETLDFDPFNIERAELEAFADAIMGRAPYPVPLDEVLAGIAAFEGITCSIAEGRSIAL